MESDTGVPALGPSVYVKDDAECKKFIEAVVRINRTGVLWRDLPEKFGKHVPEKAGIKRRVQTLHSLERKGSTYFYLPSTLMHEFGHTAGLHDLYNFRFGEYRDYIMFHPGKRTAIPDEDIDYLRDVYRNHAPHVISMP